MTVIDLAAPITDPTARTAPDLILGTDTSHATSLEQVLEDAGLDWGVYSVDGNAGMSVIVDDREISTFAPDRQFILRDDNNVTLSMVGADYHPISNAEAFASTAAAARMGAVYESAGETDFGRRTFITMGLPEALIRVGGKDVVRFSIRFQTSHASGAVKANIRGVRQWCTNGCTTALRAPMGWSIRHTASASERLAMVEDAVRGGIRYAKEFAALGEQLISTPMSLRDYEQYIDGLYLKPDPDASKAAITRYERRRDDLMGLFQTAAIQQDAPGSAWSAAAAATEYDQWFRTARSADSRARHQFNGAADRFTDAAFSRALDFANR
ncbi:DUF932 domain-containing protein [Gordonia sihwensis]|uniref:DUF932 domain-containing protein n=1 Tax=Gordonia sihwensis TaxID=173559 RepID=UPI0005F0A093|nr:DUF932 domain-containing protein [Gordonia sihwensis]KJR10456.1 hypothetical protein UG54_00185 [Gordonia sihwensis]